MKFQKLDDFTGKQLRFYLHEEMEIDGTLGIVEKGGVIVWKNETREDDDGVRRDQEINIFIPKSSIIYWETL